MKTARKQKQQPTAEAGEVLELGKRQLPWSGRGD